MSPTPTAQAAGVLIDGPAPRPPQYTLIGAAQVVPMTDDEHYILGVALRTLPCGPAHTWDGWNHTGNDGATTEKVVAEVFPVPTFRGFGVYLAGRCNTRGLGGTAFADRIRQAFVATEAYAVEREFWTGELITDNPTLARPIPVGGTDTTIYPHADTATTAMEGLASLEAAIASTGRAGIIHCSPSLATMWASNRALDRVNTTPPTLQTINGTVVVPGYGYQTAASTLIGTPVTPTGHPAPTGTREWAYATGQVEIRMTQPEIIPGDTDAELWQAVDRTTNELMYEAIRYYVVDWDTCFKAAVLVDRAT